MWQNFNWPFDKPLLYQQSFHFHTFHNNDCGITRFTWNSKWCLQIELEQINTAFNHFYAYRFWRELKKTTTRETLYIQGTVLKAPYATSKPQRKGARLFSQFYILVKCLITMSYDPQEPQQIGLHCKQWLWES